MPAGSLPRALGARAAPLALALALALLAGCASTGGGDAPPVRGASASSDRDTQVAVVLAGTLQSLQRLARGTPAEQAELVASARQGYERTPGGSAQLRYALVLATPGHAARDAEHARQLLRALAAQPEALAPLERALGSTWLAQLDRELGLQADNQRLQAEVARAGQDQASAARRAQLEADENARLRRLLDEAQAKLAAIAQLERNLSERKGAPRNNTSNEARK